MTAGASQPELRTARLLLRPFRFSDAADVQRLAGAKEVAFTTKSVPHPYPDGAAEAWIATHAAAFAGDACAAFAITGLASGELFGSIELRIDRPNRRAVAGYWIGVPYWNRGYATEAMCAIVAYGFDALALNRIEASFMSINAASGRVMAKAGMTYEGRYREDFWKDGRPYDTEQYAILASDRRLAEPAG